jgi:biopolymer transport protein ExbB
MSALAQLPPPDLTPWHMILGADIIVKVVMGILAAASIATWTTLISKSFELAANQRQLRRAMAAGAGAPTLAAFAGSVGRAPNVSTLVETAKRELLLSEALPSEGVKERIGQQLLRVDAGMVRAMSRGTGILATIGSCAPFIGLFGTVWGIMNSFVGISQMQTTNLAVVAPGIAEALLATAAGLVAAIPAVVIYNGFARAMTGYRALLGDLSALIWNLASRDLDRQHATTVSKPAPDAEQFRLRAAE